VTPAPAPQTCHASCVAYDGRAVLILGASGRGKSALALKLMALGAQLVADDRTVLTRQDMRVMADAPPNIRGRIEARFVGILNGRPAGASPLRLIVDLDQTEIDRLPPQRSKNLMGIALPLLHNSDTSHFPAAILQYLKAGRSD